MLIIQIIVCTDAYVNNLNSHVLTKKYSTRNKPIFLFTEDKDICR